LVLLTKYYQDGKIEEDEISWEKRNAYKCYQESMKQRKHRWMGNSEMDLNERVQSGVIWLRIRNRGR
jgi:hypothetical protein